MILPIRFGNAFKCFSLANDFPRNKMGFSSHHRNHAKASLVGFIIPILEEFKEWMSRRDNMHHSILFEGLKNCLCSKIPLSNQGEKREASECVFSPEC